jgi:hypothetical protein
MGEIQKTVSRNSITFSTMLMITNNTFDEEL